MGKALLLASSPGVGLLNTPTASLLEGKTTTNKCPVYDTIPSDGDTQLLKFYGRPLLPLLPGPLGIWIVITVRVLSMSQIELRK